MGTTNTNDETMRDGYDFSGGVRSKHFRAYREGHMAHIHKGDGTTSIQYFTEKEGRSCWTLILKPFPQF